MNIPTYFTLIRIFLIPVMVMVYYMPFAWSHFCAGLIFVLAGFTDWLDGYLARLLNQASPLGAFLDPVADKLLVVVALILLVGDKSYSYLTLPAAIIVSREIIISALREWMAEIGKRTSVAVSYIGKLKTALQMIAITLLLAFTQELHPVIRIFGYIFLYLSAGLTVWSMCMYLRAAWPNMLFIKD